MPSKEMGRQEQINAFTESSSLKDPNTIEGIVNYLTWRGDEPWLYFVDSPAHFQGVPLAILLDEHVTIEVGEHERCGNCGEPSDITPCHNCTEQPPFATCIQQPGSKCTFQECPFETYKRQSCSNQFTVYLTATDRIKVGITGSSRLVTRWRKQAATHGLAIAKAKNRRAAGIIEDEIGNAAPLFDNILNGKFGKQTIQAWSDPLQEPIEDLVTAAVAAGSYIPDRLQSGYLHNDHTREEITEGIEPLHVPTGKAKEFPHNLFNSITKTTALESTTGRFIGIRGCLLTTTNGYVNINRLQGHRITIRTEAPFTDLLEDELEKDTGGYADSANQDPSPGDTSSDNTTHIPAADFM